MKISRPLQIALGLIVALILVSIIWPTNPLTSGIISVGSSVINPIKGGTGKIVRSLGEFVQNIRDIKKLSDLNKDLEKENKKLIQDNSRLKELEYENKILRGQLKFSQEHEEYKLTAAEVVGRDPNNLLQFITINRGVSDGLKKDMPVISEGFLVGRISQAGRHESKVFLITNPSSVVNAIVQESRATGVVRGGLGYNLVLESIAQDAKVELGNLVTTSGIGGTYPKGLVIGKIDKIDDQESEVFKKCEVFPLIDLASLEVVFVITN